MSCALDPSIQCSDTSMPRSWCFPVPRRESASKYPNTGESFIGWDGYWDEWRGPVTHRSTFIYGTRWSGRLLVMRGAMIPQQPLINHRLRIKRLTAGLTEGQLAEAVARLISVQTGHGAALDGNYISKLERGRITWPNSVYRAALRELFDAASDAELGFYAARTRRDAESSLPGKSPQVATASSLPAVRQQVRQVSGRTT